MTINWLIIPTFILAFFFFWLGKRAAERTKTILFPIIFALLSLPGLLISLYYLHLYDDAQLYYKFRALPFIELSASLVGFMGGWLQYKTRKIKHIRRYVIPLLMILGLLLPYIKQLLMPVNLKSFEDRWHQNACLQSSHSSCGPASIATLLKQYGKHEKEADIAAKCYTTWSGTENWYMIRYLRSLPLKADYLIDKRSTIPIPQGIAGVKLASGVGHYIAILNRNKNNEITFSDPLFGTRTLSEKELMNKYKFTGFYIKVEF